MKKEITCIHCNGTGKYTVKIVCDECGEENKVEKYEGKELCLRCRTVHQAKEHKKDCAVYKVSVGTITCDCGVLKEEYENSEEILKHCRHLLP